MCSCIDKVNEALAGTNTRLDILNLSTGNYREPRVKIGVLKRDSSSREKAKPIIPTYCPFCGEKYP